MKMNDILGIRNTPIDVVKSYLQAWQERDLPKLLFSMQGTFRSQFTAMRVSQMFFMNQISEFKVIEERIPDRGTSSVVQRDVIVDIAFMRTLDNKAVVQPTKRYRVVVNCEKFGGKPNANGVMLPAYVPSPNGFWGVYPTDTFREVAIGDNETVH